VKLAISDASSWKRSIDAVAALIDEGTFEFDETGMVLKAMDPSQIAMVDFRMPKSAFNVYDVKTKKKIGVDLAELSKVTRRVKPEDRVELEIDGNKLNISFIGKTTRKFVLPLLDSTAHPSEPKIEFDGTIKVSANEFKDVLGDVELVSNYVVIEADADGMDISSRSESGQAEVRFTKDTLMELNVKTKAKAMFPLEYLKNMTKNTDMSNIIDISIKSNAPIKITYGIGDGTVTYFLAPRIEEGS